MKLFHVKVGFLVLLGLLTGCVNDDMSDCGPQKENVTLAFRYIKDAREQFAANIETVEVVVFDERGYFVLRRSVSKKEASAQKVQLRLDPGKYRFVCWGNVSSLSSFGTFTEKQTTLDMVTLQHTQAATTRRSANGDPLFYALRPVDTANLKNVTNALELTVPRTGTIEKTIDFTAAHKTIEVFIAGFPASPGGLPRIEVTNVYRGYNFYLQTLEDQPMTYNQTSVLTQTDKGEMAFARFYTPLFNNETPIQIQIKDPSTNVELATVDLSEFLKENNINLTPCDYDLIRIEVQAGYKNGSLVIHFSPWEGGTPVTPGL